MATSGVLQCPLCPSSFQDERGLILHIRKHSDSPEPEERGQEEEEEEEDSRWWEQEQHTLLDRTCVTQVPDTALEEQGQAVRQSSTPGARAAGQGTRAKRVKVNTVEHNSTAYELFNRQKEEDVQCRCEACGLAFRDSNALDCHKARVHSNCQKPEPRVKLCLVCGEEKTFVAMHIRYKHIKRIAQLARQGQESCEVCGKETHATKTRG